MSTNDVPGANPINDDELAAGCWGEHEDGSLVYVESTESGRVVFLLFDLENEPPVRYLHALTERKFKTEFSWPPVGTSKDKWTWHDKTAFDWDRVMKVFPPGPVETADEITSKAAATKKSLGKNLPVKKKRPSVKKASGKGKKLVMTEDAVYGDVNTAASRVARHLGMRGQRLKQEDVAHRASRTETRSIFQKLRGAIGRLGV